MIKEDYFNTISICLLLCFHLNVNFITYFMFKLFVIVSSINHIIPSEFRNNIIVKPFLTQLILRIIPLPVNILFINIITIMDFLPLLSNKLKYFEIFGGIIRSFFNIIGIYNLILQNKFFLVLILLLFKSIYFYERNNRMKNNRNNFGFLHIFEHIDIFLFLYYTINHNYLLTNINIILYLISTLFIIPIFIMKIINSYLINHYLERLPNWFDLNLLERFKNKLTKNYQQTNLFYYIIKIFSHKLSYEIMSWYNTQVHMNKIIKKMKDDNCKFDVCIGVCSGGAFLVKYIANEFNTGTHYLKSKVWSDKTILELTTQVIEFQITSYLDYVSNHKLCLVDEIDKSLDISKVKNVLLFDDSIASGKTIYATKMFLMEKYPNIKLTSATIFIPNEEYKYLVDYYSEIATVPICWEWGVELD